MKKMVPIILILLPFVSMSDTNLDLRNQMLDSEIEKYTKTRDEKYDALKQCEKSTQGFKIAGITTLIATGVGVYGNIKLAQKAKGKSGSGGSGSTLKVDDRPQGTKNDEACELFCSMGTPSPECSC